MESKIIESTFIEFYVTKKSDIKLIIEMENNKENLNYILPYLYKQHLEVINDDNNLHITIKSKSDKKILGFIILSGLKNKNNSIEFRRIVIVEKHKGIGRESIKLIKKLCFKKLRCHRLWLDVFDDNQRAISLYLSEGFVQDGKLRESIRCGNAYRSLLLFSLLKNEYFL